jgi:GNAT superfamily N-acetyltransferase
MTKTGAERVAVRPLTPERWRDLVELFGPERGANRGCWCMWFRLSPRAFDDGANEGGRKNRAALKRIVDGGRVPGLLAYLDDRAVGWVSMAPREEFPRIERSPRTRPPDDRPAWSIVCFYIRRGHRSAGVATALLRAAVDHARSAGARLVEAYPVDPAGGRISNGEGYWGLLPMYERAGFREVERRLPRRPIVRRAVRPPRRRAETA